MGSFSSCGRGHDKLKGTHRARFPLSKGVFPHIKLLENHRLVLKYFLLWSLFNECQLNFRTSRVIGKEHKKVYESVLRLPICFCFLLFVSRVDQRQKFFFFKNTRCWKKGSSLSCCRRLALKMRQKVFFLFCDILHQEKERGRERKRKGKKNREWEREREREGKKKTLTFSVCACAGVLIFSLLLDFDFELRNRNCAIDQKQQMGKKFRLKWTEEIFFFGFLESFYLPKVVLIHFHQIHKISLFPDTCEKLTSLVLHNFTFVSSFEIVIEWNMVIVCAKTF